MSLSLDAKYYYDPLIHDLEHRKIFRKSWQLVGPAAALGAPGSYLSLRIGSVPVFVIRGDDGLRGFINVCRHRGALLLESGSGQCEVVRCPYHDWRYNLRGELIDTPWFGEPTPFVLSDWPLDAIGVQIWRGLLFIAIEPEMALERQLGDLPAELADVPLESYALAGEDHIGADFNWKTYVEQFVEYYHTPAVHAPDKTVNIEHYTAEPGARMMKMLAPPGSAAYGGRWLWAWPNWTLSAFPGGIKTSRVNPISAEKLEIHFQYFFADTSASGEPARRRVMEATRSIFKEDTRICLLAQQGYRAAVYRPGPLHPRHEKVVAYFQDLVRQAIAG